MESDDVFGGAGDDIIEDPFGDDVLRGNAGNDVISDARGANLLFGDDGVDYIIQGQDASEAFGGTGDDFILGGAGKDFQLGNEGNDWMEGGAGFDTLAGDNSELFFNSPIIGHDVLFNQGDEGDYDAESGDDIMGSGPSVFRYEGMFGFDWAIGKGDFLAGVNFDMAIPIFTTAPNDVLKDRFDQVEGLSGWNFNDVLRGDDRGHKGGGSSSPDSVPTELFADHLLTQEGIDRITGLNDWMGGPVVISGGIVTSSGARETLFAGTTGVPGSAPVSTFRDGNILMGGNGNDAIQGRGGYDLIDGDAYLNVRIKIVQGGVTYSAESMNTDTTAMGQYAGLVFNTNPDGSPNFASVAFGGASLNSLMLNGTINPGNMSIVREILDGTVLNGETDTDTAVFQGLRSEYDIEGITLQVNLNGAAPDTLSYVGSAQDLNGDGFISVRDRDTGAVGATVWRIVDGVATQITSSSRGALTDDLDLLKNIEQLQFADQIITISDNNRLATGIVTIADPTQFEGKVTPYVGQILVPTLTNFSDPDGIPLDSNGKPVGLTFEWQTTEFGSNSGWSTITTSDAYTVRSVDPGHVLRAVAVFQDSLGNTERIISAGTDNPTTAYSVKENSPTYDAGLTNAQNIANGSVVATRIPFSIDYDSESINGAPPADVDLTTLHHEIDPAHSSGGRFTVVAIPGQFDFQGTPLYQIVVNQGGPVTLNYEAPVHTPANQSYQFVDNQYQVVINSYNSADPATRILVAVRQFTIILNDVTGEIVNVAPTVDLNADATITSTFVPGTPGNDYATTYTENGAGVAIASNPAVADANTPQLFGATVKLTNAQAGDVLSTVGALPAGIVASFGPAVAGEITMYLARVGTATFAELQTAIQAVRFSNTSDNPVAGERTIQVTVSDGELESPIATATVTVVAVDDAPVAIDDEIITNIALGTGFVVPEWVLLANDIDPDSVLDVTNVTTLSEGFTATLDVSGAGVTVTDSDNNNNSFDYTANGIGNAATDTANVTVSTLVGATLVEGGSGNQILVGDANDSTFDGGTGNDIILAGAGNDAIVWRVTGGGTTDGRDFVDGGAGTDTFTINGNNDVETYRVYARAEALLAGITGLKADTEIVITRGVLGVTSVIAELDNIEEIVINTAGGDDTVTAIGNFNPTSLAFNTITVNGGGNGDVIDTSGLVSAHNVVLNPGAGANMTPAPEEANPNETIAGTYFVDLLNGRSGNDTVNSGSGADTLNGGAGDDSLVGAGGNDSLYGGEGNDILVGGQGADIMTGSDGNDIFDFNNPSESSLALRDVITDYAAGDIVDLASIDANTTQSGNQKFVDIGDAAFSAAGQVRYVTVGSDTVVQVNVGGSNGHSADLEILLQNHTGAVNFNL